jgi:excinuclease ABC subunit C
VNDLSVRDYPDKPGVYLMKDGGGAVLYVGKAKSLRNRIRSYFSGQKDIKTKFLLSHVADIQTIITSTEYEALLLENSLIKANKPRYNINLKDGKTYPVIRLTADEYPRVFRTRRIIFDGSEYFGPFPKPQQIDITLKLIDRLFPLRKCKGEIRKRPQPCLNFSIGRCGGVCAGKTTREEYLATVERVRKLLSGRTEELVVELREKMKTAADGQDYESAARFRDRLHAVEEVSAGQKVVEFTEEDRDYVAAFAEGADHAMVVLQIRGGTLLGRETFRVNEYGSEEEALSRFVVRYYGEMRSVPDAVYVGAGLDTGSLASYLGGVAGRRVSVLVPKRGRHMRMILMARENARDEFARGMGGGSGERSVEALRQALGLSAPPLRIEGFDIAHLEGRNTVASLVCFLNGKPARGEYRSFSIRSLGGKADDYEAIREAMARRYTRVANEGLPKPDLILIDGGKGQLAAGLGILSAIGLEGIAVASLAKKQEEIFLRDRENPLRLAEGSRALLLLQAVRDESHRFATTLHKRKRAKGVAFGVLESVEGIGKQRARRLMETFGSLEAMAASSVEEISKRGVIPRKSASRLLDRLGKQYSKEAGAAGIRGGPS